MPITALIFIANGTEEMEFTIAYDTLTRAGIKCTSAFVGEGHQSTPSPATASCSRGVKIIADTTLESVEKSSNFDVLIVPGGAKGAETMSKSKDVQDLIRSQYDAKRIVGMICAGSLAALTSGLPSQPLTSHPSVTNQLDEKFEYRDDSVVVSGNLVTSRGPGTAFPFSLKIVEILLGKEKREEVVGPMVFPKGTI
ncbi:DJ-1 [Rickenella mellea]|uniref:D-lactate dehydratase n=1 Tax=Rickenella mellea TaxID=50990 RepID=A0A4Y7PW34_9AGAM|nr:DJ-1 [Rickenella mellea]